MSITPFSGIEQFKKVWLKVDKIKRNKEKMKKLSR